MTGKTTFTQETADAICEAVADGKTISEICAAWGMPARSTVFKWLAENEAFSDQYARAKEVQAERMADELLEIADDGTNDWITRKQGESEIEVLNSEHIQRSRLRVDTRKWLMSKMLPKKYGDSQRLEHGGEMTIRTIETIIVDPAEQGSEGL